MSPALIDSMTVMSTIAGATPSRADRAKGPSSGTGSPNGAKSPIALSRATRAMRSASRGGKWNNGLAIVAPDTPAGPVRSKMFGGVRVAIQTFAAPPLTKSFAISVPDDPHPTTNTRAPTNRAGFRYSDECHNSPLKPGIPGHSGMFGVPCWPVATMTCRASTVPADMVTRIVDDVVKPVAAEMVRRGVPFSGLLYAGLAIGKDGPAVVEFNCRFGDPETQAVLALLETPLGSLLNAAATGTLDTIGALQWTDGSAVTVVVAAENYPGRPRVGDVITGSETAGVLHAGTTRKADGSVVSSGGRVLSVVGTGADLAAARAEAYRIIQAIRLPGSHFRTDIGLAAAEGRISL